MRASGVAVGSAPARVRLGPRADGSELDSKCRWSPQQHALGSARVHYSGWPRRLAFGSVVEATLLEHLPHLDKALYCTDKERQFLVHLPHLDKAPYCTDKERQ